MEKPKAIPIGQIKPNSWNPNRMDEETYRSLVEDVKNNGVGAIDPIHVRPIDGGFEVIDGEHRLKAVVEAGFDGILCFIDEVDEDEAKMINYRKNRERGSIDPFKEAELFKSLLDKGMTQGELAKKVGVSQPQISHRLSLLRISAKAKETITRVIESGKRVTPSHLELMTPLPAPVQEKVVEKLWKEPSVREFSKEVEKVKEPKKHEPTPEPIYSGEDWQCPICNALYRLYHIASDEHKFELIREGKSANNQAPRNA